MCAFAIVKPSGSPSRLHRTLSGIAASIFLSVGLSLSNPVLAAAPSFQAAGAVVSGTGAVNPAWPAHQVDDIALLVVETANQTATLSTPAGFVAVAGSPQGTGTAGGTAAVRLTVFWARATSTSMATPRVADSGNNQVAQILTFRGVIGSGDPWDVTAGNTAGAGTGFTIPGATTTVSNALVVAIIANSTDTTTAQTSGWTNASLSGLAEIADANRSSGNGGGFGAAAGVKAVAGAYGNTTGSLLASSVQARMSIALKPKTTTLGDGVDPANVTIAPSAPITDLDGFTLQTSNGTDSVTALTVTLTGASSFAGLSEVRITSSDGLTTYFSAVSNPGSNTISFSGGTPIPVTAAASAFKIRVTPKTHAAMPLPPGQSYAVGGTVTAFSSTNEQLGSDAASATVTVDNLSPAGATAVSGSAGIAKTTLNWTTSAAADFDTASGSVLYRWAAAAAGTEVPAEGATPAPGSANGSATVACVVSSNASTALVRSDGSGGSADCTTAALTAGQQYTYKVFQRDVNGNYDTGVTIGTLTPLAVATVLSINRASPDPTMPGTSVSWLVTFSQSVSGVDASAFALVVSGVSSASITSVSGSGTSWTVTAFTGTGYGTLGLNQTGPGSVVPTLTGTFTGQVYTVYPALNCISDTFTGADNSTPDSANWTVNKVSGSFTPVIFGDRLRITDTSGSAAARATNKNLFPFGNNLVIAEFDYWAYGGSGADGIAITFSDPDIPTTGANNPPTTGGFGGSLGYANRDTGGTCNVPGFTGGWIGVGIDEYGNYSNPTECRNGGVGSRPNAVAIRGSGSGATSPSTSNYVYLTGTAALGANGVSSGASGTPYRYRIILDSITDPSKVMLKVDQDKTGGGYLPLISYDVKPAITAGTQAALPSRLQLTFTGSTGGSTNNHEVDNVNICAASIISASGPHHLEIQHPSGTGLTCAASTLTVRACADAACSSFYTGGVAGTLTATGTPTVSWDGTTGGAAGAGFVIPNGSGSVTKNVQVATAGSVVFGIASPLPVPSSTSTCNFGSPSCTFTANTAGFIFSSTSTGSSYIVPAQVSGIATSTPLFLRAVQASTTTPAVCTPAIISQTAAVTMGYACNNPASCQSGNLTTINATPVAGAGTAVNLNFDANGSAPITARYDDVGQITLNARMTATPFSGGTPITLNGNSNTFVVAPHHFGFSSVTPGLIKAGSNFSATVTAYNGLATPTATRNFGLETAPGPEGVTLSFAKYQPSGVGSVNGSFSGSVGVFANGVATGTNLNWSEVGTIDLIATLASGSYLGSGLTATGTTGATGAVGRFIPDHFDTVVTSQGGGFAYSGIPTGPVPGQPFTVAVTAKNASGSPTTNYYNAGGFAKNINLSLAAGGATGQLYVDAVAGGTGAVPAGKFLNLNPGEGKVNYFDATGKISFVFNLLPHAEQVIQIHAEDADTVASAGANGSITIRHGRLRMFNAFGSEKANLSLPLRAEYWTGNSWVLNSADSFTIIPAASIALSGYTGTLLDPTNFGASHIAGTTLGGGQGNIVLSKPTPTATGSVNLAVNLGAGAADQSCLTVHPATTGAAIPWLRSINGNCAVTYDRDPSARASFGVYAPETRKTIHMRELY